ncbi:GNAT family N-acetyltransferase [Halorussus amylolyticus]|uniref:GNAT family N-acetyltransferase n=1 Tax=Halorussus amylolyticus TaxID=1126242 RepID=UPI00138F10C5|nr:GNAT family N-acetyltransferase [Halorussus amylolyticus]
MSSEIRLATPDDAGAIRDIYAPVVRETAISFQETPPSVAEFREQIADDRYPWLVYEREGRNESRGGTESEVLGFAKAGPHKSRAAYRWAVDVSAYVRADSRSSGVGTRLYDALLPVLSAQGFYTAIAVIALPNSASVGLHESMGFQSVGTFESVGFKNGDWRDVGWWQRSLGERPPDPDSPKAVEGVDSERIAAAMEGGVRERD